MTDLTPDDLAAIRLEYGLDAGALLYSDPEMTQRDVRALCDALEAAWAERVADNHDWIAKWSEEIDRAERAEKCALEESRLRYGAVATLARVQALCDSDQAWFENYGWVVRRDQLRAAIEGENS